MLTDSKLVLTLVVIGVLAATVLFTTTNEGFWNLPARSVKVERVFSQPGPNGPDFFQTPGFQGILEPRFSNVNYGPYIRTQKPDYRFTGVPADPLGGPIGTCPLSRKTCSNATLVEGFGSPYNDNGVLSQTSQAGKMTPYSSMNVPGTDLEFQAQRIYVDQSNPSGYANGNYKRVVGSLIPDDNVSDNQFGTDQGFGSYLNADGELRQPIMYDRYLYSNRQSKLRGAGDPIRGDLPIVPVTGNWFVPSVHPNIDLQAGALNVMAGVNNETNHQLSSLIYNSSGQSDTTIGGTDLMPVGGVNAFSRMNMGTQNNIMTTSAGGDVIVSSFP